MSSSPKPETKIRTGKAPQYLARNADLCPCGRAIEAGQRVVWFSYRYSFGTAERCDLCRRSAFGRCRYHTWERILHETEERARDALAALELREGSPLYGPMFRAREMVQQEAREDVAEARRHMTEARTRHHAFHAGCRVKESVKDPNLRQRIIQAMNRLMGGSKTVNMKAARA